MSGPELCAACDLRFSDGEEPVPTESGPVHADCHEDLRPCPCCDLPGGSCPRCGCAHEARVEVRGSAACETCAPWSDEELGELEALQLDRRRAVTLLRDLREGVDAAVLVCFAIFEDGTAARLVIPRRVEEDGTPDVSPGVRSVTANLLRLSEHALRAGPGAMVVDVVEMLRRAAAAGPERRKPEEPSAPEESGGGEEGGGKPPPPGGGHWS